LYTSVLEVAIDARGKLTAPRVDTAIDCGTYVNAERNESQGNGGTVMGLAKYGEVTL
jgi:isoquinoline 1-oxidoreductase beta subunit